jgi:hypothetical protein
MSKGTASPPLSLLRSPLISTRTDPRTGLKQQRTQCRAQEISHKGHISCNHHTLLFRDIWSEDEDQGSCWERSGDGDAEAACQPVQQNVALAIQECWNITIGRVQDEELESREQQSRHQKRRFDALTTVLGGRLAGDDERGFDGRKQQRFFGTERIHLAKSIYSVSIDLLTGVQRYYIRAQVVYDRAMPGFGMRCVKRIRASDWSQLRDRGLTTSWLRQ